MTELRGTLRWDEPLARHTSWRIGGPARRYYEPHDVADLAMFLKGLATDEPVLWLGLGSNLLVRDGGVRGTVIATFRGLSRLELLDERVVRAEAGAPCPQVARFCGQHGLRGAEFLAGIPGTMGGALAMNAGAFGAETWQWVKAVETVDRAGRLRTRVPSDYRIGYRSVEGVPGEWFVAARLSLEPGFSEAAAARVRELLDHRKATQPLSQPSCGSVFRNPPGDYAARLIEEAGLKGTRIGDASVSPKHANFIVNLGAARASDVEQLMAHVIERVKQVHGVELVPEVRIVGEPQGKGGHEAGREIGGRQQRGERGDDLVQSK